MPDLAAHRPAGQVRRSEAAARIAIVFLIVFGLFGVDRWPRQPGASAPRGRLLHPDPVRPILGLRCLFGCARFVPGHLRRGGLMDPSCRPVSSAEAGSPSSVGVLPMPHTTRSLLPSCAALVLAACSAQDRCIRRPWECSEGGAAGAAGDPDTGTEQSGVLQVSSILKKEYRQNLIQPKKPVPKKEAEAKKVITTTVTREKKLKAGVATPPPSNLFTGPMSRTALPVLPLVQSMPSLEVARPIR